MRRVAIGIVCAVTVLGAACNDDSVPAGSQAQLGNLVAELLDLVPADIPKDSVDGFRGLSSFYIDAVGETREWRMLAGRVDRLDEEAVGLLVSAEGGGGATFRLLDSTRFSPPARG